LNADADPSGELARAWPALGISGRIRVRPEDFQVREDLGFEPDGDGEHCLLLVRKTGCNTQWVADQLASAGAIAAREVGYSGLKDRHAVTEQWFSVPARAMRRLEDTDLSATGIELLCAAGHRRKLRRGVHQRNHFRIRISDMVCGSGWRELLESRLAMIAASGVPNYFGDQRFGRRGGNIELVRRLAAGQRMGRRDHGFALSAARSQIFNAVLSARVRDSSWNRLLSGDVAALHGTRSVFSVTAVDETLEQRLRIQDIHPSGPMWGRGELATGGEVAALENKIAAEYPAAAAVAIEAGMKQERRPLRLTVADLAWEMSEESLTLSFNLLKGGFATTVLREVAQVSDASETQDFLRSNT
jgi:tRNA pseudouridine13 synthase